MRPAVLGAATGTLAGAAVAAAARGQTLVRWPDRVRAAFPCALGAGAGLLVGTKTGISVALLRAATGRAPWPVPSARATLVGAGACAAVGASAYVAREMVLDRLADASRALDPGFATPPASAAVSGSAPSAVPLAALGREGARFVGTAATADDVVDVTGTMPVAEPVRVFVGVEAATSVEQRVAMAMAELRRTGAFDRRVLLVVTPAGSGYANSTPADVLEILTGGDCATVAVGYGLLPSFLSLGKVVVAARTQRLLLEAIGDELAGRARRPRLLLYGESLGAKVQQAAVAAGPADLDAFGVDHALWVGTPGGVASDDFHARCARESITVDRPDEAPAQFPAGRPRVWFLEHDGDPVVRFRPDLATRRPAWLPADGTRGRNVPATMRWWPGITWAQVLVDTLFATNIKPGDFQSLGHDYRADLGVVVPAAYGLDVDAGQADLLDARLRSLEVQRAARIGA